MRKWYCLILLLLVGMTTQGAAQDKPIDSVNDNKMEKALPLTSDIGPSPQEEHHGKSADEIARELANPNNSLASLTFKNQFS